MRIRMPQVEVDQDQPYANDKLYRSSFGNELNRLIEGTAGEFTLAIDGQWGDGKTTFSKMWCGHLAQEGYRAIYFDAFANDHGQDPFAPLSSVLLEALRPEKETTKDKIKNKYASLGLKFLQIGGRVGLRAVTGGLINDRDLDQLEKIVKGDDANSAVSAVEEKFVEFQVSESELSEFRALLSELAHATSTKSPLVVVLDELDRCRPTFALSLLEKVKHFFSVPGIVFVFVMNSEQMCACIKNVYGSLIDARQYLHKFIDVEHTLPPKRGSGEHRDLYKVYTRHLINVYEFDESRDTELENYLAALAQAFDLSLRDMEKTFRTVALCYHALADRRNPVRSLLYLLAVLRVNDRTVYAIMAKDDYGSLAKDDASLINSTLNKLAGSPELSYIRGWLLACLGREEELEEEFSQHFMNQPRLWRTRKGLIAYYCAKMDYFG